VPFHQCTMSIRGLGFRSRARSRSRTRSPMRPNLLVSPPTSPYADSIRSSEPEHRNGISSSGAFDPTRYRDSSTEPEHEPTCLSDIREAQERVRMRQFDWESFSYRYCEWVVQPPPPPQVELTEQELLDLMD